MSRHNSRKAAATTVRFDHRPIIAITAMSVLVTLVLALALLG